MRDQIDTLLQESLTFPPSQPFRSLANASNPDIHALAANDLEGFWAEQARALDWMKPWDKVLEWTPPHAKWFVGGKLNASVNCVDRHFNSAKRGKVALLWEGEGGEKRQLTYGELYREVNRFASGLRKLGIHKGDRVAIYMPMIPEVAVAMLACARIGAPHSVVFGGFSAESLRDRIIDATAKAVITADGGYRRGQVVPLKRATDEAVEQCPSIEHMIVVRRVGASISG